MSLRVQIQPLLKPENCGFFEFEIKMALTHSPKLAAKGSW
jgi:hypothetical protein